MARQRWWINSNVLLISMSAFFADMGYQAILAGFPVFLVLVLHAPAYYLGIAYALAYGIGALFSTAGGILGDRLGRKRVAIIGNVFILILPFLSFAASAIQALSTFSAGWWARNFRSPPRRAMLSESTTKKERPRAFGLLHALDVGGGVIAVAYLLILLYLKMSLQSIFIFTAIPISISTVCLILVKSRKYNKAAKKSESKIKSKRISVKSRMRADTLKGVLISTALFGFSSYSLGFPIITIASRAGSDLIGIFSYFVYLAFSAAAGYIIGQQARRLNIVKGLAFLGYLLAAIASAILAFYYIAAANVLLSYFAVALLGVSLGAIETFEPTIISLITSKEEQGRKQGYLTSSRSIGLFTANIGMGILYTINPSYSYVYAAAVASAAVIILLYFGRDYE
jgi:MFS family permease